MEESLKSHFLRLAIKTAPENDLIYDGFGIANADDLELTLSIQKNGIQEPLVVSADNYLLSGHRRLAAAAQLKMREVPVRKVGIVFADLNTQERLEVLRRFNQQREKTPQERVREKLLDIDPEEAHLEMVERRRKLQDAGDRLEANVIIGARKHRAKITTLQFLNAAQKVIEENREYWPLSVRRIHYLLLNDPPLKHDRKPDSTYDNTKGSYQTLTRLLIRARLNNDIPMRAIEDSTRPVQLGGGYENFEEALQLDADGFLAGYNRNLQQGQPYHIEIMLEKNALRTMIAPVAREYCIPMTTGRGFSSLSPRYDLWRRYRHSGKSKLVLLMLTDFDPDGEEIAASFARSLRDDFGIRNIHPVKVALTAEDVMNYDLPSDMDAKPSSPNYRKFVNEYGVKVAELDAAPVELLQNSLRHAIESVLDVDAFNQQIELEKKDAAEVEAYRRVVFDAIRGVNA